MKNTQLALRINAIFSALTGTLLLLFSGFFADYFSQSDTTPFWILGIGLLGFAGFVFYHSNLVPLQYKWVRIISYMDIGWVLGSIALILFDPFTISSQSKVLAALIAGFVAFFAFHQLYSLSYIQSKPELDGIEKS